MTNIDYDDSNFEIGKWNEEEHYWFVDALKLFKKDWKKVANYVKTRSIS